MLKELPADLLYHRAEHSLDVLQAAERLASAENIGGKDLDILKTAALFHDSGFIVQYRHNEQVACEIAIQALPEFGYTGKDIGIICGMIMATAIPQNPKTLLEQILCDADLDYLGRDDFESIAQTLRSELKLHGREFSEEEWITFQLDFLDRHRYFTRNAKKMRDARKQENIAKLKKSLG